MTNGLVPWSRRYEAPIATVGPRREIVDAGRGVEMPADRAAGGELDGEAPRRLIGQRGDDRAARLVAAEGAEVDRRRGVETGGAGAPARPRLLLVLLEAARREPIGASRRRRRAPPVRQRRRPARDQRQHTHRRKLGRPPDRLPRRKSASGTVAALPATPRPPLDGVAPASAPGTSSARGAGGRQRAQPGAGTPAAERAAKLERGDDRQPTEKPARHFDVDALAGAFDGDDAATNLLGGHRAIGLQRRVPAQRQPRCAGGALADGENSMRHRTRCASDRRRRRRRRPRARRRARRSGPRRHRSSASCCDRRRGSAR